MLTFRNILAKPKTTKELGKSYYLVGNELNDIPIGKQNLKTPFDKNVLCNIGLMEHVLDYTFSQLGNCSENIQHPVFLTEALCNPLSSRSKLSELLFECYQIPAILYGVDSAFGFYGQTHKLPIPDKQTALVISLQNSISHVYPIINGKIQYKAARRIDVGGERALDNLIKTMQLKYPYIKSNITNEIVEEMFYKKSYCAENFQGQIAYLEKRYDKQMEEIRAKAKFMGPNEEEKKEIPKKIISPMKVYKDQISYENEKTDIEEKPYMNEIAVQLPFNPATLPSEEEVKRRQEIRKEQGRRLKEYMQKKREEKKIAMQQEFDELKSIEKLKENDKDAFKECMLARGFEKAQEFEKRIQILAQKLGIKLEENGKEVFLIFFKSTIERRGKI